MYKSVLKTVAMILCVVILVSVIAIAMALKYTPIPKLAFEGDISNMWEKSDVRDIRFTYDDGKNSYTGYATLKVQGTSSLGFAKKNYTIQFYKDEAHTEKMKIDFGWGAQSKYCLKANWIDRTHARNIITANLATEVQKRYDVLSQAPCNGTIDGYPIEILDNGSFLGLYTLNIPKDEWQFGMDKDNPNHIVLCGENWEDAALFRDVPNFESWGVEVGEESDETLEKFARVVDFVMNSSHEEFREHFEEYIDLDAMLTYYIIADFAMLHDNMGKNMLMVTYDGVKWYPSLYDLDTSWGTHYTGEELYDYHNGFVSFNRNLLFERFTESFPEEIENRYFELRQDLLTKEHVMQLFNDFQVDIPFFTRVKETVRWGIGKIHLPSDIPGYGYDQVEEYLDVMIPRLDEKYAALS